MSLDLDDSLLRSVVDGMADEQGRISVEDFSRMICEHMGSSIEQAQEVTHQLDPEDEGFIAAESIYQAFRALIPSTDVVDGKGLVEETDSSGPNADEFEEDTASTSSCDPNQPEEFSFAVKSGGFPSLMANGLPEYTSPLRRTSGEEEFVADGDDEDLPSGAMSPVKIYTPRRSIGISKNTSSMSLTSFSTRVPVSPSASSIGSVDPAHTDHQEDQIMSLSQKVQDLTERLSASQEENGSAEAAQRRLKQEYTSSQSRLHALEEQLREREEQQQVALRNVQERHKLKLAHMENMHTSQLSSVKAMLSASEEETRRVQALEATARDQCREAKRTAATLAEEAESHKKALNKKNTDYTALLSQQRRETEGATATIAHLQKQLEEVGQQAQSWQRTCDELKQKNQKRKTAADQSSMETRHLEDEVSRLKKEVARVTSRNNELSKQLVEQGKMLMESPHEDKNVESIAAEMNEQSTDEMLKIIREERNYSSRLKQYNDNLLIAIMDKCPELLEVRST